MPGSRELVERLGAIHPFGSPANVAKQLQSSSPCGIVSYDRRCLRRASPKLASHSRAIGGAAGGKQEGTEHPGVVFLTATLLRQAELARNADDPVEGILRANQPVAAAGTAEQDQALVGDKLAASADEDGRSAGPACPLLLVAAGGGTSEPAAVWRHAAEDLGAACAGRVAPHLANAKSVYWRTEARRGVCEIDFAAADQPP